MIFNLNFIWNSMCKGNSCFNIFQNLTGGSIFCPKTQTPSLWGWENAEFEKVSFAKSAKAFDLTLQERMENAKDRAFQGQFFRRFFPQWLLFFFQYHSVCQRWTFFRRVIISKNQGDLLENTNWSFLVRSLGWKQFFIFLLRLQKPFLYYLLFANFQSILINKS